MREAFEILLAGADQTTARTLYGFTPAKPEIRQPLWDRRAALR